ncbi:rRNA pseudouridine synthase [Candidatus Beckwithbacteria bacterium]|nr:rRNA pseudouridine synthase [Candidatus Beckwithbacteria bacterium]
MIRINKYLASLGIASRRKIDQMIIEQKIQVNDKFAQMGQQLDPQKDKIKIENKNLDTSKKTKNIYIILNKPAEVLSTCHDNFGRKTILDLVKVQEKVYPVGRLDYNSQGLILLTNDGELTNKITHPKNHIPKIYEVLILGKIKPNQIDQLENGIELNEGWTQPTKVKIIRHFNPQNFNKTLLQITLFEGKKRQIRKMFASLHLYILSLTRVAIGKITLGNLAQGKWRFLTKKEINLLKKAL